MDKQIDFLIKASNLVVCFVLSVVILASCKKDEVALMPPTVNNLKVASISKTDATVTINVANLGGRNTFDVGIAWDTQPIDTANFIGTKYMWKNNSKEANDSVSFTLPNLKRATKYYIKSYISDLTVPNRIWSLETSFVTLSDLPAFGVSKSVGVSSPTDPVVGPLYVVVDVYFKLEDDGGSPITNQGIVWSKTTNPTISSGFVISGKIANNIVSVENWREFMLGSTYYVRGFVTTAQGVSYSEEVVMKTPDSNLLLEFVSINPTTGGASLNGLVSKTSAGLGVITEMGFVYDTQPINPNLIDFKPSKVLTKEVSIGSFSADLTDIKSNTKYYIRPFATTAKGTFYGNERVLQSK
jgi:hypothetical protein